MSARVVEEWAERNQRWLSARLAHWRERIESLAGDAVVEAGAPPADDNDGFEPAAMRLAAMFGLSAFETELLVLAAGVEIDATLRDAVARAQGVPVGRPMRLSLALALQLVPQPHWDAVSPIAPLRAWSLIDFDASAGFTQATLRIDERILHAMTGVAAFDERLTSIARAEDRADDVAGPELAWSIARALAAQPRINASDLLEFRLPATVAAGAAPVRLRVDGIDSLLVRHLPAPPVFDPTQTLTVPA